MSSPKTDALDSVQGGENMLRHTGMKNIFSKSACTTCFAIRTAVQCGIWQNWSNKLKKESIKFIKSFQVKPLVGRNNMPKRKRMTEEQRLAAVERLAKAREARGHDGSKSVHENLRNMDEDSPIHWKKVKVWIKEIGEELRSMRHKRDSKSRKERTEFVDLEVYHSNLIGIDSTIYAQ